MSTLYMVRHGQASFGQANYDKLSELGERQATLLGQYWASWGQRIDAVYVGNLERQTRTAGLVAAEYEKAGMSFPEPITLEGLNEYSMQAMLTGGVPKAMREDPQILKLIKEIFPEGKPDPAGNPRALARLMGAAMDLWVEGKLEAPGMESWPDFVERVRASIKEITTGQGSGKTVAAFTSGGPISAALQIAMKTPEREAMRAGWLIVNSSVSEFRFSGERFSLAGFNSTPHLNEPSLATVR